MGEAHLGRRNSKCKGPEVEGTWPAETWQEVRVAGMQSEGLDGMQGRWRGGQGPDGAGRSPQDSHSNGETEGPTLPCNV